MTRVAALFAVALLAGCGVDGPPVPPTAQTTQTTGAAITVGTGGVGAAVGTAVTGQTPSGTTVTGGITVGFNR